VLKFLEPGKAELVSGCSTSDRAGLHRRFLDELRSKHPEVLESAAVARPMKRLKVGF
jgi:hypothetical protein